MSNVTAKKHSVNILNEKVVYGNHFKSLHSKVWATLMYRTTMYIQTA